MGVLGPGLPGLGLEKAKLVDVRTKNALTFKYNPEQFSLTKRADWAPGHAGEEGQWVKPTYTKTQPGTIGMDIFFDAYEEFRGDVTGNVRTLLNWTKPDPDDPKDVPSPPILRFEWGSSKAMRGFRFYLESVTANYTMFRMDGTPIRATCSISLVEASDPSRRQNPTSGGRRGMQSHILVEGETLHSVAWAQYGQAGYWRGLAAFNDIDDPLRIAPGTRLLIPPSRDAAGLS